MYIFTYLANYNNMKKFFNNNYIILIPILILNIISLCYLANTPYFTKQLIWLSLSYIFLYITSKIKINKLNKYFILFYLFSLFLLTIVLIYGREINGAKAWLHLGPISIQPSELAKIALLLYLPSLTMKKINKIFLFLVFFIPALLTYLEPDTGAIIIYLIILLSCLKYTKKNKKRLLLLGLLFTIFIGTHMYLFYYNKDLLIKVYGTKLFYRLDRLISFKEKSNIQAINSTISIGSNYLLYIPENHNDFIFAAIISKYNLVTTTLTYICLCLIIIFYINKITKQKNISNIYNFAILNMLFFQIFYNILMNLSLVPIVGIPLPFLSYGGSYLTSLYITIGLSINYLNNRKVEHNKGLEHKADMD